MSALSAASARTARVPALLRTVRPSTWTWGAIGVVVAFVAISCWWLSRDLSVPSGDPGSHLLLAITYRDLFANGSFEALLSSSSTYPIFIYLVGGLAALVGGVGAAAPIVGLNVIFVPLLALGCYQTGRLVRDARTGFLATLFALGSPLVIEQFHVFMLDAPQTALVAVSVWLILASRRFRHVGAAALAGLAVGLGIETKETFPIYIAGFVAIVLLRGAGWRNWRGVLAFAATALAVGAPWYVANLSKLEVRVGEGWTGANHLGAIAVLPQAKPPLLSLANLTWYGWATLNGVLFAPLACFAAIGVVAALRPTPGERGPPLGGLRPELVGGMALAWLGITIMPHHDLRYAMPLMVFLAVLGTDWIGRLGRGGRRAGIALLACAVLAATLGAAFGVGHELRIGLTGRTPVFDRREGLPPRAEVTVYSDLAFHASGPRRENDVLGFFKALRREGLETIVWAANQSPFDDPVFDLQGAYLFARLAAEQVRTAPQAPGPDSRDPNVHEAVLVRASPSSARRPSAQQPCMRLSDGTGLWVRLPDRTFFCPARKSWLR